MKKYYPVTIVFWMVLSIFVAVSSYRMRIGELAEPGPGFLPFLIGILLFVVSSCALIQWTLEKRAAPEILKKGWDAAIVRKRILVVASLLAYAVFLEQLGYLMASCLLLIVLFRVMSSKRWPFILASSLLISLATYFGFSFIGVKFPAGMLYELLR